MLFRSRWLYLYLTVAFLALVPIMSYHIISEGLPKTILLVTTPVYLLLSWSSYSVYKAKSKPKE
jgi:hypothetical protein